MGNYEEARKFNVLLLDREPQNMQAQSLEGLIEKKVQQGEFGGMGARLTCLHARVCDQRIGSRTSAAAGSASLLVQGFGHGREY